MSKREKKMREERRGEKKRRREEEREGRENEAIPFTISQYLEAPSNGEMSKYTSRYRPIEPKCCCCKVSSFLKCTYVSIIVLSLCTLIWAVIAFFFHSSESSTTFEQLLYKAYYDNPQPHLFMIVSGEENLKIFDLFTSIAGISGGLMIFIALLKPNSLILMASRVYMLVPMCMITIQNVHFVSGAYGVPLTKENEQLALVIVMLFLSLFVINFFTILNLLFSLILLCRLPSSQMITNLCAPTTNVYWRLLCSISRKAQTMAGVLSATGLTSPRKREYGHWSEVISSAGKVYYYNRVTEQSQWIKPDGWEKAESVIFPVIDRLQQSQGDSGFSDNIQFNLDVILPSAEFMGGHAAAASSMATDIIEKRDEMNNESTGDQVFETDCMMSDEDMDVSYGNSPIASSSSPSSSIDARPQSSKENQDEERTVEEEAEESPIDKYYRSELVTSLHYEFETERIKSAQTHRSSCAFEIQFATQQTQMYRARALARTAMAKALENQIEVATLSRIQQHLDKSQKFFQANFESEMRRILKEPNGQDNTDAAERSEIGEQSAFGDNRDVQQVSEMRP